MTPPKFILCFTSILGKQLQRGIWDFPGLPGMRLHPSWPAQDRDICPQGKLSCFGAQLKPVAAAHSPKPTQRALNPPKAKRNKVILEELKEMNKEIISN